MPDPTFLAEIKQLDIDDRILLVGQIWDSVADDRSAETEEPLGLSQAQKDELDRRLAEYEKSPEECLTWKEVKSRLRSQQ